MKRPINYAGGYWQWESEFGQGVEDTRDGAELEYVKSFLKNKGTPQWNHILMLTEDDVPWVMEEIKKERRRK